MPQGDISPHHILITYIALLSFQILVEGALECLNVHHADKFGTTIPEFAVGKIDQERYEKSVRYTKTRGAHSLFSMLFTSVFTLVFIVMGWFGVVERLVFDSLSHTPLAEVCFVLLTSFIFYLADLPSTLYGTFKIETAFGFNTTTISAWLADQCKSLVVSTILLTPILFGIFWFMQSAGSLWWLDAFLLIAAFQLIIIFIYPVWIAPLFNTFSPLEDGELRERLFALSEQTNFPVKEIYSMDGSKRSRHSNAYFTGLGANRRIVLYDTLIESLSIDELCAVLAHEIGHHQLRHIPKGLALSMAMLLFGLKIMAMIVGFDVLFIAFGFSGSTPHATLIVFLFLSSPLMFFLKPALSAISRKHEYQADEYAAKTMSTPDYLIAALTSLTRDNLANLRPHPWYSFFHYSHPSVGERIGALQNIAIDLTDLDTPL
jgi:STE24 endopeptidase